MYFSSPLFREVVWMLHIELAGCSSCRKCITLNWISSAKWRLSFANDTQLGPCWVNVTLQNFILLHWVPVQSFQSSGTWLLETHTQVPNAEFLMRSITLKRWRFSLQHMDKQEWAGGREFCHFSRLSLAVPRENYLTVAFLPLQKGFGIFIVISENV